MLPFDGLLFDKDGTLLDLEATWGTATGAVLRRLCGTDEEMAERLAILMQFDRASDRLAPTSTLVGGTMAEVAAAWGPPCGRGNDAGWAGDLDRLFAAETLAALTPLGRPDTVLAGLRAEGYRLGMATNDSAAAARQQVDGLGLHGLLEFVAGYDSGHGGKPEPGMVLAFARAIGAEPRRVAMVGDTPHDMVAGRAAGAVTVAVLSGPVERAVLEPLADHLIGSVADLPELLRSLA